jgi:hypothetical protein
LKCPQCGTVFRFRSETATLAFPSRDPSPPPSTPAADAPGNLFALPPEIISSKKRRQPRTWKQWVKTGIKAGIVVALAGAGASWLINMAIPWYRKQLAYDNQGPSSPSMSSPALNCQFTLPGKSWKEDPAARLFGVASVVALRRTEPNGWLNIAARDYKTRAPRDAELVDEAIERLGGFFKNVGWSQKSDDQVAGQRAQHLAFQGDANQVVMQGDCYILSSKGIAYWIALWGPAELAASSREEFDEVRRGFSLLKEREGWTEKRPPVVIFEGNKARYWLRDTEGIWEEWRQPRDADALADMLIQAKDKVESKNDRMARVLVLVLQRHADLPEAVKAARAHVTAQQRDQYPETTLDVILGADGSRDRDDMVGEVRGHVLKLHVKNTKVRERFLVLAVVQVPEGDLVIQCECDWKRRSLWEADFKQLLSTLSLKSPRE